MTGVQNGIITEHRSCLRCGYDIHGLLLSARCPECGCGAGWTLAVPLLRYLGSKRVRRVRTALCLVAIGLNGLTLLVVAGVVAVWVAGIEPSDIRIGMWMLCLVLPVLVYCGGWIALPISLYAADSIDLRLKERFRVRWLFAAGLPALILPLMPPTMWLIAPWTEHASDHSFNALESVFMSVAGPLFAIHVLYSSKIVVELACLIDGRPLSRISKFVNSIAVMIVLAFLAAGAIALVTLQPFLGYFMVGCFMLPLVLAWSTLSAILAACLVPHFTKELEAATATASDASSSSPAAAQ